MSDKTLTAEQMAKIRAVCNTHERFETESWKILALLDAAERLALYKGDSTGILRDALEELRAHIRDEGNYPLDGEMLDTIIASALRLV